MRRFAVVAVVGIAACGGPHGPSAAPASYGDVQGWRQTASGKPPTQAEFAAVVAACQDRQKTGGGSLDQCLADLGLRRVP